jgi:predicted aspartyl protease
MERIAAFLAVAWLVCAVPVAAQEPAVPAVPPPAGTPTPADELALGDEDLRMTVPVTIADKGSWPFIIDTGAERTVVSHELAAQLALAPGRTVRVTTMAGTAATPTAQVPLLRMAGLAPDLIEAPLYARRHIGAAGMLGLDALRDHAIGIDFDRQVMTLTPSRRRPVRRERTDEIVVVAKSRFGQLIVTDARWRGRRIAVVIDTGAALTIANPAMLQLARSSQALGPITMVAATGEAVIAAGYRLDRLEIGRVGFEGVPVAVADVAPFRRFGLQKRPALLLGMDTLRLFRSVEIDFPNRTIVLKLPRATVPRRSFAGF